MTARSIDDLVGARVHFKGEHLQRAGAFKFRGPANAVFSLDERTAVRGVAAHSSGHHAAALALAASIRRISCHVVMPTTTPRAKQDAARSYGATIVLCDPTLEARNEMLAAIICDTGATEIDPYDHPDVIAGQGTAARDLLAEVPAIDMIIAPVSGGGLLSGTAIAAHGVNPEIRVWGAEPTTVDDAYRSLRANRLTPEVEPSAAVAVAAVIALARDGGLMPEDIGVILSGGNVDLGRLPFDTHET
jgi:threonine dehydratase